MRPEKQKLIKLWSDHFAAKNALKGLAIEEVHISGATIIDVVAGDPLDLGALVTGDGIPLFSTVSIESINQDQIADCYFLSFLGALAMRVPGQALIKSNVYYDPSNPKQVLVQYQRQGIITRVHCDLMISPIENQVNQASPELWATIMEKAYAAFRTVTDTFHSLDYGSSVAVASDLGCVPAGYVYGEGAAGLAQAKALFDKGLAVTMSTPPGAGRNLVSNHVYTVTGFNADGSMNIRNPWGQGYNPVPPITVVDNVYANISGFSYGTIPVVATIPVPTPTPVSTIVLTPTTAHTSPGGSVQFSATGGQAPYVFSIASGLGWIDSRAGNFAASGGAGVCTVKVTDATGATATAIVTYDGTFVPTQPVTPPVIPPVTPTPVTYTQAQLDKSVSDAVSALKLKISNQLLAIINSLN